MFQFRLPQLPTLSFSFGGGIRLPKVEVHDIEERPEKRARTLKHLVKHNHISHSIIYNELRFHNHVPHLLGSAYILGAESEQLNDLYEHASKDLEPWHDSPGEISKHDWTEYLGKRECVGACDSCLRQLSADSPSIGISVHSWTSSRIN
jgi:hypothetical protein